MTAFTNPQNNHQEDVHLAWLWALLFGPLYFAYKRCFGHAIIAFTLAVMSFGLTFIIYAFFANKIVCNNYLSRGWLKATQQIHASHTIEEEPDEEDQPLQLSHITFSYIDANGATSTRDVIAQNIYGYDDKQYMKAHCNDNDEQRTFRLDRIQSDITNLSTGEIINLETLVETANKNTIYKKQTTLPKHLTPPTLISGSLFKISDKTDYVDILLDGLTTQETEELTQQDILNIEPYELEFEIDEFSICLTKQNLINIDGIPEAAADLLQEQYFINSQQSKPEPIEKTLATSPQSKALVNSGYLTAMTRSQAVERVILEEMTLAQLEPLAKSLHIKVSQTKSQLIQQIAPLVEPTTPLPSLTIPNTSKLNKALEILRNQYDQQAEYCMKSAPPNYAKAIKAELEIVNS